MADRFGYGEIGLDTNPCRGCEDYDAPDGCKSNGGCGKPITNADRIRAMSDEELADAFTVFAEGKWYFDCPHAKQIRHQVFEDSCRGKPECNVCFRTWLQSPVGGEQNG